MVAMRMFHQTRNVFYCIRRFRPRTKGWAANVHGIRAMINRLNAEISISSRGEQFKMAAGLLHEVAVTM
jgi:hypothetical protein